jgi:hypothetical protein
MNFDGYVYYITRIENLGSIMERGILSYNECDAKTVAHQSFALATAQEKRGDKKVPNALPVHDYACLYFDPRNKAMFRLRKTDPNFSEICILVLKAENLMKTEGAIISDMNAAAAMVSFYPATDLSTLSFERIYAKYWTHPGDPADERLHGYQKCAELLIPHRIDPEHILGACAQSNDMAADLRTTLTEVMVDKDKFFL